MPLQQENEPIPHHVLEKFLGRGAFGEVWRARGPGGVKKAAKFIRLEDRSGIKELLAIQRIKQIHHPHLVTVTDVWLLDQNGEVIPDEAIDKVSAHLSHKGMAIVPPDVTVSPDMPVPDTLAVAMTLADCSLTDRLKECQREGLDGIPVDELLVYMQEAAKGIDFLNQEHAELGGKSIQHCDIKPQNLLLVGGAVQVCDFGLVRLVGESKTCNQLEGTLAYMAPESARGKEPTPTTDQYSLAISYYQLRTGKYPFEETQSTFAIINIHLAGKLDFSELPEAEQQVLKRATALKPEARFPSNSEFVRALCEAQVPATVAKRSSWLDFSVIPVVVLAAVALLLLVYPFKREPVTPPETLPPTIQLPVGFAADESEPAVIIGGQSYPARVVRSFDGGDEVVFLLIHDPGQITPYYIMRDKVWNSLFQRFVDAEPEAITANSWQLGAKRGDEDLGIEDPRLPVFRVTVDEAYAFSRWLGGEHGHLPSIKQWDTAAGLFQEPRQGAGPFLADADSDPQTLLIAVDRSGEGPMPVGAAVQDISPYQIRDMAGNGFEFTRNVWGGFQEVPLRNATDIEAIMRRGRSYKDRTGPLTYADLEDRGNEVPWIYNQPSDDTSFRVVLERFEATSATE